MTAVTAPATSYRRLGVAQIGAILGDPEPAVVAKVSACIGATAHRFIAHSPFVCLATASNAGADCSPRGDAPGFVRVIDNTTLALPDRTGNALADSFRNVLLNPAVGMLFLIPGLRETLRVNGTGYVTDDPELLQRFDNDGRPIKLALVISVEQVYFHCGKALIRSRLWDPATKSLPASATLGVNVFALQRIEHGVAEQSSAAFAETLEESYRNEALLIMCAMSAGL